jgi:hypothetical protein
LPGIGKRIDVQEWANAIRYRIASGQVNVEAEAQRLDHR